MATACYRATQMPTRPAGEGRCAWERRCWVCRSTFVPPSFTPQVALGFSLWGEKMLVKHENCSSVKLNRSCRWERESLSRPAARWMDAGGCSAGAAERRAVRAGPVPLSPPGGRAVSPAGEQLARAPKCTCLRVGKGGEMCAARGGIGAAAGRCTATPPRPAPAPGGEAAAGRGARRQLGQDAGGTRPPPATRAQRRPRGESAWPGWSLRVRERKGGRRCWGAIGTSQGSGGGRPNSLGGSSAIWLLRAPVPGERDGAGLRHFCVTGRSPWGGECGSSHHSTCSC